MDKGEIKNIINRFAEKVAEKYDFIEIILFGSYAKGTYHDDSDIDIAVILKDYNNVFDIQMDLMRIRREIDSRIEPYPIRKSDFNDNNPMAYEIKKYGKIIKVA